MGRQGDSDGTVGGIFGWGDSFELLTPSKNRQVRTPKLPELLPLIANHPFLFSGSLSHLS
jgi:hypothetical protein